jgi:hypothetical protein
LRRAEPVAEICRTPGFVACQIATIQNKSRHGFAESGRYCLPPKPWRFVRSWPKAFKSAIYAIVHLLGMQASTHRFEALFDVLA